MQIATTLVQQLEPTEITLDTPLGRLYQQFQDAAATRAAAQDKLAGMEAQRNAVRHWLDTTMIAGKNANMFTRNQAELLLLDRELLGARRAAERAVEVYARVHALWIQRYGTYTHAVKQVNGDTAMHGPLGQEHADLLAEIRTAVGADDHQRSGS
jgi:hypothetical protein